MSGFQISGEEVIILSVNNQKGNGVKGRWFQDSLIALPNVLPFDQVSGISIVQCSNTDSTSGTNSGRDRAVNLDLLWLC